MPVSPKVDEDSLQDLSGLEAVLSGFSGSGLVPGSTTALLLAMAVQRGLEVPELLLEPRGGGVASDYPATFATSYGTSMTELRRGSVGQSNADDCFFWFGQDGLFSSLSCFAMVGDAYRLWNRHPKWDNRMKKVMKDENCRLERNSSTN